MAKTTSLMLKTPSPTIKPSILQKNMKNATLIIFFALIAISGCSKSEKVVLIGKIKNAPSAEFILEQQGDKFSGHFLYINNKAKKIEVQGTRNGETLRLEEFNDEQGKLTGIFEGKFDGVRFQGNWRDPKGTKKIPFEFHLKTDNPLKIEYTTFDISEVGEHGEFDNGLSAKIGPKKYPILPNDDESELCIKLIDVRDFNNDGFDDVLIEHIEACGGWAVPFSSLFFCIYDVDTDAFILTESFGSIGEAPIIEKYKDQWSIKITSVGFMHASDERYLLEGNKVVMVEQSKKKPLKAIKELRAEEVDLIRHDLDGDGGLDSLVGTPYSKWSTMICEVRFSNGKIYGFDRIAISRLGILSSKTKKVNDLVVDMDEIYIWNGNEYEAKYNE